MKALVAQSPGVVKVMEVPIPEVGPNDVLARVKYCGVCATDIAIITGISGFVESGLVQYPVRIGHEWSGIVEKVGSNVKDIRVGDHVVAEDGVPCLQCDFCKSGRTERCRHARSVGTVGEFWNGAFAEYMLMPAPLVYKLKPETDLMEAAMFEPACIAMHGVKRSEFEPDDTVLVIGTGPIGLAAVGLLKALGCKHVIMTGRRDSKLEYAKKMGADIIINDTREDTHAAIMQATQGFGVDCVIESSGNATALKQSLRYVRAGGKVVLLGFYETLVQDFDIDRLVVSGIDLLGIAGMPHVARPVIDLMESGKVNFKPLITSVMPFSQVEEAVQKVIDNDGDRIKVLVEFE